MAKLSVEEAKKLSIVSVAESLGMELKRSSPREYYWTEHDSLKINTLKNTFKWYSRPGVGGDSLDLVQAVKGVSFKDALHFLSEGEFPEATIIATPREPFTYQLGRYEEPFEEGKTYLQEVRGLSEETIQWFHSQGVLAQARKKVGDNQFESVVVFKNLDQKGKILGANLQGIVSYPERHEGKGYLKQILYNSDGYSGLNVSIGSPKRLIVMESPIDLMSYYELHKDKLEDVRLVSMDGLKEGVLAKYTMELLAERLNKPDYQVDNNKVVKVFETLNRTDFFKEGKHQDFITLAVDNDKAGQNFIQYIKGLDLSVQVEVPKYGKDWNEELQHIKKEQSLMVETKEIKYLTGIKVDWSELATEENIGFRSLENLQEWLAFNYRPQFLQTEAEYRRGGSTPGGYYKTSLTLTFTDSSGEEQFFSDRIDVGAYGRRDYNPFSQDLSIYLEEEYQQIFEQRGFALSKEDTEKAPENILGQEKNAEGTIGDFPDKQEAAPLPEATTSQPLNDLSPNQTQPQLLLHFSIKDEGKSINKRNYHPISEKDLTKLNRYAPTLQQLAKWYRDELADSKVYYFYKEAEEIQSLQVSFDKDKFIHLTGVFPYREGQSAEDSLEDFAEGRGEFDSILLANKGAAFDKLKVLPELPAIVEADSFYFGDLSDVPKLHLLDLDKAIKSGDEDILLALRTVDNTTFPASLMKLRSGLLNQLSQNAEENIILGVYREKNGVIEELSLNEEFVFDGGQAFEDILKNKSYEEVTEPKDFPAEETFERDEFNHLEVNENLKTGDNSATPEMTATQSVEAFTRVLDTVYNLGMTPTDPSFQEATKHYQDLYNRYNDFNLVVAYSLENGLLDSSSDFASEWLDDRLNEQFEVTSLDVHSGKITEEQFYDFQKEYLGSLLEQVMMIDERQLSGDETIEDRQLTTLQEEAETAALGNQNVKTDDLKSGQVAEEASLKNSSVGEKNNQELVAKMIAAKDTKALSEHMKEGVKQYLESDQYKNFLTAMSKLHRYSTRNIQLILMQKPDATMIASFKNWKDNFQRHVQKGAKSLRIWAPVTVNKKDKETGEFIRDDEGNFVKETFFKLVPVFDVSQTEGAELPKPIYDLEGTHDDYTNLYRAAKEVAQSQHVTIEFNQTPGQSRGYYSPMEDKIVIKSGLSEQQTLKTLFHEMAHADLHNMTIPGVENLKKSTKELQAESVAYVVASHYGLDTGEYTFAYLANWSEDTTTLSDLEAQLTIVQKEANSLINRLDAVLEKQQTQTQKQTKFSDKMNHFKQLSQSKSEEKVQDNSSKKYQEPEYQQGRQMT